MQLCKSLFARLGKRTEIAVWGRAEINVEDEFILYVTLRFYNAFAVKQKILYFEVC